MAGTLPAAARGGRARRSGGRGAARAGGGRAGLAGRAGAPRPGRARRGARAAALRRARRRALTADLVHVAVGARAVDVELAAVALDDHERVAVAGVAAVVDEHPVARAAHDLHVVVTLDLLRALALGRGGRRRVGRLRLVLVLGVADGRGLERGERGAALAAGLGAVGVGRREGVRRGGDVGHELGTGSVVSKERTMAPIWAAASRAPAAATASIV